MFLFRTFGGWGFEYIFQCASGMSIGEHALSKVLFCNAVNDDANHSNCHTDEFIALLCYAIEFTFIAICISSLSF